MKKLLTLIAVLLFLTAGFTTCNKNFDTGRLGDGLDDNKSGDTGTGGDTEGTGETPVVTGGADYFFNSVTVDLQSTYYHGESFSVSYEVKNQGDQPGSKYNVCVFVGSNSECHNNQDALSSLGKKSNVITFNVTTSVVAGNEKSVQIKITPQESDLDGENNGESVGNVEIKGRADLIVESPNYSTTGGIGNGFINFSFYNQGTAVTSGTVFYNVYLTSQNSTTGEVVPGSKQKSNPISGSIEANTGSAQSQVSMYELCNDDIDCSVLPQSGAIYAIIVADSNNTNVELDETNNRTIILVRSN